MLEWVVDESPDPERTTLGGEARLAVERAIGKLEPQFSPYADLSI